MTYRILDMETNGLAYDCDKIHILSWTDDYDKWEPEIHSTGDPDEMRKVLSTNLIKVCHNGVPFDMTVANRILGVPMDHKGWWDTLATSWYTDQDRISHGLHSYAKELGLIKPEVEDWNNVTWEQMVDRCESDVLIGTRTFQKHLKKLKEIYGGTNGNLSESGMAFVRYLSFKMDCLREQEANRLYVDIPKAQKHLEELEEFIQEKHDALVEAMPKVPVEVKRNRPKNMKKKDGSWSTLALKWFDLMDDLCLPRNTEGEVAVVTGFNSANPRSVPQIKEWLFDLGWDPCTYKYDRNKTTGDEKKIPQVRYHSNSHPKKGQLTESVLKLKETEPAIAELEGLTVATHRADVFRGFIRETTEGRVAAGAHGLTNTLRFKHRSPIVNLPGVDKPWGKEIRSCLVSPEPDVLVCGADVSSLESCTKRHFMWDYDPEYVTEMSKEGFDEHLDLAKHAGVVTQEDIDKYNSGDDTIKPIRTQYKATNYSAVYGVGAAKLSRELRVPFNTAESLLEAYWGRNWAVKEVAKAQFYKTLKDGSMWLYNPISKFYYPLRYEKDIFSTLNQGTGVFIFDTWVKNCRDKGIKFSMQMHDEHLSLTPKNNTEEHKSSMEEAMAKVNTSLKLNVTIGCDIKFGHNYAEVH